VPPIGGKCSSWFAWFSSMRYLAVNDALTGDEPPVEFAENSRGGALSDDITGDAGALLAVVTPWTRFVRCSVAPRSHQHHEFGLGFRSRPMMWLRIFCSASSACPFLSASRTSMCSL
jgi:hypothetical protein